MHIDERFPEPTIPDESVLAPPLHGPCVAGSRILLVEDDAVLAACLGRSLEQHGYEVELVGTSKDARVALEEAGRAEPFDLVVSDVRVPRGCGVDLLWWPVITARRTPVILLTASPSRELRAFVDAYGADLLEKPFSASVLLRRVLERLREHFLPPVSSRRRLVQRP